MSVAQDWTSLFSNASLHPWLLRTFRSFGQYLLAPVLHILRRQCRCRTFTTRLLSRAVVPHVAGKPPNPVQRSLKKNEEGISIRMILICLYRTLSNSIGLEWFRCCGYSPSVAGWLQHLHLSPSLGNPLRALQALPLADALGDGDRTRSSRRHGEAWGSAKHD